MTPADRVLSVALVVAALIAPRILAGGDADRPRAIVTVARREIASVPLNANEVTVVRGRVGEVRIQVQDGAVRILDAACPNRLCVLSGAKRRPGEVIACVPNEVLVRIVGGSPDPSVPDAVTR
jgi:hypothetical protein